MKILSASQIRQVDQFTIEHEPIPSIDLMERAAKACFNWIVNQLPQAVRISIFCGQGNNGGDGLAIARMLVQEGKEVRVFIVRSTSTSVDFNINLERLQKSKAAILYLEENALLPDISDSDLLVDAIFGTGLKRKIGEWPGKIIRELNATGKKIVSIDLPSGLLADEFSEGDIIRADYTLTFQQPKLAFLFADNAHYTGKWVCLNIGLSGKAIDQQASNYFMTDPEYVQSHLRQRPTFSHKGSFGHALLIAGSRGKYGAASLAARACIRSGAGLLTVQVPQEAVSLIHQTCQEAMVIADENLTCVSKVGEIDRFSSIGIGPGLGTENVTADALLDLLRRTEKPMVIDADALNIIAENPSFLQYIPKNSILTPHPKEFARLAGESENGFVRLQKQVEFAVRHQLVIILKGAYTSIALPGGEVYFNPTGNPALAKGGSGDVLTGICTGFLAQHYSPEEAAILSVYLHGFTADQLVITRSEYSVTAGDIIEFFGKIVA